MDKKLFFTLLVASISSVIGPKPSPFTDKEQNLLNLLTEAQTSLDTKDTQSPKDVVAIIEGNVGVWFGLIAKCHYVLKDQASSVGSKQACEYLREHDCLVSLEMTTVLAHESDQDIDDRIQGLKDLYSQIHQKYIGQEITLCFPLLNPQYEKREDESYEHVAGVDSHTFRRIGMLVTGSSRFGGGFAGKLESVAGIAQKYEEAAIGELNAMSKGKLSKMLPDIEKVCEKVEMEEYSKLYKNELANSASEQMEGFFQTDKGKQLLTYCQLLASREVTEVLKRAFERYNVEQLLPKADEACRSELEKKGLSFLYKEWMYVDRKKLMKEARSSSLNAMARKCLQPHQTTKGKEVTPDTGASSHSEKVDSKLFYMCNIVKRHKALAGK